MSAGCVSWVRVALLWTTVASASFLFVESSSPDFLRYPHTLVPPQTSPLLRLLLAHKPLQLLQDLEALEEALDDRDGYESIVKIERRETPQLMLQRLMKMVKAYTLLGTSRGSSSSLHSQRLHTAIKRQDPTRENNLGVITMCANNVRNCYKKKLLVSRSVSDPRFRFRSRKSYSIPANVFFRHDFQQF